MLLMVSSLMILLILLFSHQSYLGMGISLELTERFNSSTLANLEMGVKVKVVRVDSQILVLMRRVENKK